MSYKIGDLEANFKLPNAGSRPDAMYYDVRTEPFEIYGLYEPRKQREFRRLPKNIAAATSDGVCALATNTAGGRVRFATDSSYIVLRAEMNSVCLMGHMALSGSSGFDLYIDSSGISRYALTFVPPTDMKNGYESCTVFPDKQLRQFTVNFPLYNNLTNLYIGLEPGATLAPGMKYRDIAPVLYYGSSITQGACASRPGNAYQAIISRRFNVDYINFGFSGNCKAEQIIADFMATLDISAFVCDYDHNSPNIEYLAATHGKLYETIRKAKPELPVIFVSRPDFDSPFADDTRINALRRGIVHETYLRAIKSGDKYVDYVDGCSLFSGENRDCCTVDGCHPNDAGFTRMADIIGTALVKHLL